MTNEQWTIVPTGETTGLTGVSVSQGGTGKTSWTSLCIPFLSTATSFGEIPIGSAGNFLKVNSTATGYVWNALVDGDIPTNIVRDTRQIIAGTGLTGGGNLQADRTISLTTPVTIANGGTGLSAIGTANQLLGVNAGVTGLEYKTLSGTANQINVVQEVGSIILSTPQNLHITATPQFAKLGLGIAADTTNILTVNGNINIVGFLSWSYYKTITITGSTAGAQANYQVKITVSYIAEMNADFSDIRFTDASNNPLSQWRESYTASTSAIFWVKIPDIPASPDTVNIRMHYGKAGASLKSNISDTFVFADDFSDSNINTSKWNVTGNVSISEGNLKIVGSGSWNANGVTSVTTFDRTSQAYMLFWKIKFSIANNMTGYSQQPLYYQEGISFDPSGGGSNWYRFRDNAYLSLSATYTLNTWYNLEIKLKAGSGYTLYINGAQQEDDTTFADNNHRLAMQEQETNSLYYDYTYVRKYISPEPTIGTPGSQETSNYSESSSTFFVNPSTEKVGIKTTTPQRTFDVIGNWGGNTVVSNQVLTATGTITVSDKALTYRLTQN
ncbi:MAG: DUF2341 domain-containing protein, partial [Bacillota bacterium]